ncbi:MAG: hydrogenase maturation protease [Candidatus Limnocylindria bacterium]
MTGPPLVIGFGNGLRADDGVGPEVAAWLAADPRMAGATVLARHQLTPDLAADIARAAFVVLIDASMDQPPGEISVAAIGASRPSAGASTHHVDPALLVDLAAELYGRVPEVIVIGVGAASTDGFDGLSAPVRAAIPRLVDAVVALVDGRTEGARRA